MMSASAAMQFWGGDQKAAGHDGCIQKPHRAAGLQVIHRFSDPAPLVWCSPAESRMVIVASAARPPCGTRGAVSFGCSHSVTPFRAGRNSYGLTEDQRSSRSPAPLAAHMYPSANPSSAPEGHGCRMKTPGEVARHQHQHQAPASTRTRLLPPARTASGYSQLWTETYRVVALSISCGRAGREVRQPPGHSRPRRGAAHTSVVIFTEHLHYLKSARRSP